MYPAPGGMQGRTYGVACSKAANRGVRWDGSAPWPRDGVRGSVHITTARSGRIALSADGIAGVLECGAMPRGFGWPARVT